MRVEAFPHHVHDGSENNVQPSLPMSAEQFFQAITTESVGELEEEELRRASFSTRLHTIAVYRQTRERIQKAAVSQPITIIKEYATAPPAKSIPSPNLLHPFGIGDNSSNKSPMKTDTIFYHLFQAYPAVFFELMGQAGETAVACEFTSVELKELAFRLDGLFVPWPGAAERLLYFVELQFQKDPALYARLFTEIFVYLYQYTPRC